MITLISFLYITLHWGEQSYERDIPGDTTNEELVELASEISNVQSNRIRIGYQAKTGKVILRPRQRIEETLCTDLTIIDSGPQIGTRLEQFLEYVPCIFIWLVMYYIIKPKKNFYVISLTCMWAFHYVRRSFECAFIHIFSSNTLPIFSVLDNSSVKNCAYYWIFAGLQAYFALRSHPYNKLLYNLGILMFIVGEIGNSYCHIKLRLLRPKGSINHYLPKGFLFDSIISPNYTFEILSWFGFSMSAQTLVSFIFPCAGSSQMWLWAEEKRRKLGETYPEALERGRLLPFKNF